jgi:hypothetical protein
MTIHRSRYVNSAQTTRFLDIRVARRFLIQGSTASREEKLSIVFWGKKLSDDVIIQILPQKTIDSVSFFKVSGPDEGDKASSRNMSF